MGKDDSDLDIDKVLKQLKQVRDFIDALEKIGVETPLPLVIALKNLERALKEGKLVAEAAGEASDELKKYERDLNDACKRLDDEMQGVCEAQVARQWQWRGVNFTLDYKKPESVTSKVITKHIQKLTPSVICKHWDRCAKGK